MKISKITFREDEKGSQAWIVINAESGEYLGTWHITDKDLVEWLKKNMPKKIGFNEEQLK